MNPIKLKSFQFSSSWIIYEDSDILVVNKPSGLLSVPGRGPDKQESLASHLESVYGDIFMVHRLDMDTSGLMVVARHKPAHRHLSIQFQDRKTHKTYLAICAGKPLIDSGTINLPMRCDWENRPLQMIDFIHGKHASTLWKTLDAYQFGHHHYHLKELTPITGRSHQLRLHMKMLGTPILGDNLYADPLSLQAAERLLLHASQLSFTHPTLEKMMSFEAKTNLAKEIKHFS